MRKRYFEALCSRQSKPCTTRAQMEFLDFLWSSQKRATTFLATSKRDGQNWKEHPINGRETDQIELVLRTYPADKFNIYFSPNAFDRRARKSDYAMPTRYAWCDIDDASPDDYKPKPNILWETSPNRYQGIWVWDKRYPPRYAEQISKNLWTIYGGDCGWSVTKMLRLPGTINHKDCYDQPRVRVIRLKRKPRNLPRPISKVSKTKDQAAAIGLDLAKNEARVVVRKYRRSAGLEVGLLMTDKRVKRPDRSKRVFQVIAKLVEMGATDDEIGSVLSVNAYFVDKWGADVVAMEQQIAKVRAKAGAEE